MTLILNQVSSSVSLYQLRLSKEIIFLVFAVSAVTKGVKRARDESPSDSGKWPQGWRRLDDNDVWTQFGEYWRKHEITSDSPSITLAYEERGEEDPEYRLQLTPTSKNKIIVRGCYSSFYDHLLNLRRTGNTGLVLTGQPGTGMSSS